MDIGGQIANPLELLGGTSQPYPRIAGESTQPRLSYALEAILSVLPLTASNAV